MKTEQLNYDLPSELIAQQPPAVRSDSRLLILNRSDGRLADRRFSQVAEFLRPGDCLVLNDTKVLQARFLARRTTGAKLQGLFLAVEQESSRPQVSTIITCSDFEQSSKSQAGVWQVMIKGAGKVRTGETIHLKDCNGRDYCTAEVLDKTSGGRCRLKLSADADVETVLNEIGFPPLPPYIKRKADSSAAAEDKLRYQTVYARRAGAVAAPTAGLHFTTDLIEQLKNKGICFAYITLHVGAGTFTPIPTEIVEEHKIHPERFAIDQENATAINSVKQKAGRIVAVGTTTVRTLETAAAEAKVHPCSGTTRLLITPGYKFKIVDAMVTNFHLPKSTLLALVAAFAGLENVMAAYQHAIDRRYCFYSYGDATLII